MYSTKSGKEREAMRSHLEQQLSDQLHEKATQMVQGGVARRETPSQYYSKIVVTCCNTVTGFMGWVCVFASLYLYIEDFGDFDKAYFLGGGTMLLLFGLFSALASYLGGQGVYYQGRITKHTHWKGTRILKVYQACLIIALVCQIVWVSFSQDALRAFYDTAKTVSAGGNPPLTSIEQKVGEKFDAFFFGATSQCATVKYEWFWGFVNTRCAKYDENMSQKTCQRCSEYSVVICAADTRACYADPTVPGNASLNPACPYVACRQGILQFVIDRFPPFSYFAICMLCVQVIQVIATFVLIFAKAQRDNGQYDMSAKRQMEILTAQIHDVQEKLRSRNLSPEERKEEQQEQTRLQEEFNQKQLQLQKQQQLRQKQQALQKQQQRQQQQQQQQHLTSTNPIGSKAASGPARKPAGAAHSHPKGPARGPAQKPAAGPASAGAGTNKPAQAAVAPAPAPAP